MKIAIPTEEMNLDSLIDDRFGRAKYFLIYDTETKNTEWIDNEKNMNASQGSGLKASQSVIESGAEVLLSVDVGPKSFELLEKSGIIIYKLEKREKIMDAVKLFEENKLNRMR